MEKQQILQNAQATLNQPNQPWEVTVQGDSIVAYWKWMDATFFAPNEISDETKEYKFIVTLLDNHKWSEQDSSSQKKASFSGNGLSFGTSTFSGHQTSKSFNIGLGKSHGAGEVGMINSKFDSQMIKNAVRSYLTNCGWKKKGFFG